MTGSPHHGNAGRISIPVETVPSVNISAVLPHKDESQSSCSPPPSEGTVLINYYIRAWNFPKTSPWMDGLNFHINNPET